MRETIAAIITAFIGLATLAVILSSRSNTTGVIGAAGGFLSSVIGAATSPLGAGSANAGPTGMLGNQVSNSIGNYGVA